MVSTIVNEYFKDNIQQNNVFAGAVQDAVCGQAYDEVYMFTISSGNLNSICGISYFFEPRIHNYVLVIGFHNRYANDLGT